MKNKTFFGILTALVAVGGIFAILQFTPDSASANLSKEEAEEKISDQFPGEIMELELDKKGNRNVYEIEIKGEDHLYDLEIDAKTGEILELEEKVRKEKPNNKTQEQEKESNQADKPGEQKTDTQAETKNDDKKDAGDKQAAEKKKAEKKSDNTIISYNEAKSIALSQYDGEIIELELDEDDGMKYYEIELETAKEEIEMEIDAYTGEIISISKDDLDD